MRSPSVLRRVLIVLAPLLVYTGLTLLLFRPLLPDLATGLHDRSDTTLNAWIIAWQAHVLPRAPLGLFDAPIFHPLSGTLALSEILWPLAPLAVPLLAATGNPILTYNLLFLGAFPLAGLGAYALALQVTGSRLKVQGQTLNFQPSTFNCRRGAAFLAGLIYAFSPHQFGHLSQLQLLSIAWLPLTLLFLDRFWVRGRARDGLLFALCAALQTLSAFYYGFQVALAVGLYVVVRMVAVGGRGWGPGVGGDRSSVVRRQSSVVGRRSSVGRLAALVPWLALAALLIAPFALPYLRVRGELGLERSVGETAQNAATLSEWVRPPAANPLYRGLSGLASAEGGLFPGLIVLGLAAVGLGVGGWGLGATRRQSSVVSRQSSAVGYQSSVVSGQRSAVGGQSSVVSRQSSSLVHRPSSIVRLYWLLLGLSGIVLSLGPRLKLAAGDPGGLALPFGWLYEHVPGMTAIRAPGRFANIAFLALAMLAALGAMWVFERLGQAPPSPRSRGESASPPRIGVIGGALLLAVLILAEYAGGQGRFAVEPMPPADTPLYAWLARQPTAVIVELPLTSEMAAAPVNPPLAELGEAPWPDYNLLRYQYFQTGHWQPTIDGYSGFVPPHHRELGLTLAHFPDERSLALLRGLGVERVIVHGELMDAFQPGRAAELRKVLPDTPDLAPEREFGSEWVYHLSPPPSQSGLLSGRFWSTSGGQAFLLLASADGQDVVVPPGGAMRVQGSWQPDGGGAAQTFAVPATLPLMVSAESIVPLDLPGTAADGAYRLRLEVSDARVAAAPYEREVAIKRGTHPATLLAVQGNDSHTTIDLSTLSGAGRGVSGVAEASAPFTVSLSWRLLDRLDADASVSARVVDASGRVIAQDDRALSGGIDLVRAWQPGMVVTTTHALRLGDAPGRYTFQAFLYRPDDPTDLFFLDEAGEPAASLSQPLKAKPAQMTITPLPPSGFLARFGGPPGDELYLLSAEPQLPVRAGQPFRVSLAWAAARPPAADYTVFAHLVSPSGELLAQRDAPPQDGRYPTSAWDAGEIVTDTLDIALPPALAGQTVCLRLGLYDPATNMRLARLDAAGDHWQGKMCWTME